jgi:hypothetical protein
MIVQIRGRAEIPAGSDPRLWVQGPDGTYFPFSPFNPTPWFQYFPDTPGQPSPLPTTVPPLVSTFTLYQSALDKLAFLKGASKVLAKDKAGQPDDLGGVVLDSGIVYTPNFGVYNYGDLAKALDFVGLGNFNLSALLYDAVTVSGPSKVVHWRGEQVLVLVGTVKVDGADKPYALSHDAALVARNPVVTAVEISVAVGKPFGHGPGQV